MEFKVPNEASSHAVIDSITDCSNIKQVSFSTPLHSSTTTKKVPAHETKTEASPEAKTASEQHIQDHNALQVPSLQDHKSPFLDYSSQKNHSLQDHFSDISVKDM